MTLRECKSDIRFTSVHVGCGVRKHHGCIENFLLCRLLVFILHLPLNERNTLPIYALGELHFF